MVSTVKCPSYIKCPSCGKTLEEYKDGMKTYKNTYTAFDLDEDTRVIICNCCGFGSSPAEFIN